MSDRADLQAIAEREIRDALLRFLARIRHLDLPIDTIMLTWHAAARAEADIVDLTIRGIVAYGSPTVLAARLGLDPAELGKKAADEIERIAQMMELTNKPISREHDYY